MGGDELPGAGVSGKVGSRALNVLTIFDANEDQREGRLLASFCRLTPAQLQRRQRREQVARGCG